MLGDKRSVERLVYGGKGGDILLARGDGLVHDEAGKNKQEGETMMEEEEKEEEEKE